MALQTSQKPATIALRVQPASPQDRISIDETGIRVKLKAMAVDGQANKRLIAVLAKALKVTQASVTIKRGLTSKNKLISIAGLDQSEVDSRLAAVANAG